MWLHQTFAVFQKELLDSSRDRRTLASSLLYALFGPFLVVFMLSALAKSQGQDQPLGLTVVGSEHAPKLVQFLEMEGVAVTLAGTQAEDDLREGRIDLLLRIPADYPAKWRALEPAPLDLLYDSSKLETSSATSRLRNLLDRYNRLAIGQRLQSRGLSPAIAQPLDVRPRDFATSLGKAARILGSFPIFFLLAVFIGGLSVAIDTTAGERERSSLESLLVHATPTSALVVGKWATATVFNLLSATLTLAVTVGLFRSQSFEGLDIPLRFGLDQALPTLALLLPLALMVPALQMSIAIYSRNFKEAQSYLQVLMFVPMLPGFMLAFSALTPKAWMHLVPILAQEIQLVDLLAGKTVSAGQFFSGALVSLALTALLLVILSRSLRREKIVLAR